MIPLSIQANVRPDPFFLLLPGAGQPGQHRLVELRPLLRQMFLVVVQHGQRRQHHRIDRHAPHLRPAADFNLQRPLLPGRGHCIVRVQGPAPVHGKRGHRRRLQIANMDGVEIGNHRLATGCTTPK